MTEPSPPRLTLLVLYSPELERCRRFYSDLGLPFVIERHGDGPEHYAAAHAGAAHAHRPRRPHDRRPRRLTPHLPADAPLIG